MSKIYIDNEAILPLIKETLESGKKITLTIRGNSMFPLFSDERDTVVIERAVVYKPRDIVFYLREGNNKPILHRIIGEKDEGFVLCGDNQQEAEYPIKPGQILGRVCEFERKGKKVSADNWLYKLYSFVWCINIRLRKYLIYIPMKIKIKMNKKRDK